MSTQPEYPIYKYSPEQMYQRRVDDKIFEYLQTEIPECIVRFGLEEDFKLYCKPFDREEKTLTRLKLMLSLVRLNLPKIKLDGLQYEELEEYAFAGYKLLQMGGVVYKAAEAWAKEEV